MPLDTCITNVGEYYSSHYLDSTFAKDLKGLISRWHEEGSQSVPRKVISLTSRYFSAKAQALDFDQPEKRWQAVDIAGWHSHLLAALGYSEYSSFDLPVSGNSAFVPVIGRVNRYNKPWLIVCETSFCLPYANLKEGQPTEDPLDMEPLKSQLSDPENPLVDGDWHRAIGKIFTEEEAPRWIMFLAGSQILLLDKHTYAQGRYLAFDLDDAFGRKEKNTFNHIAAFLSTETLCPDGESDEVLHDKLEEQSHRFAHGVTEKLQVAVREAIELLANEWVEGRRRRNLSYTKLRPDEARPDGSVTITAEDLRHEALVYVYRLLFCFYAESRGSELGILPIIDEVYRLGYSLESLRDLEQVPLTPATETGRYFHIHLQKLFKIIHEGFNSKVSSNSDRNTQVAGVLPSFDIGMKKIFQVQPLTATLFDPQSTPLLDNANLTNLCLQRVILKLSLSSDDKSRIIGRVNYAELGINQLGAVYEGLLSYKGMFADRDLIQVKPASKSFADKKTPTWFVPKERLEEFKKDEVERLKDGRERIYPKGSFILHLSGIDREQSASYYTPEVLTKCLVEEALRELLKDYTPADADKILNLKICEPAMGSGAFLNEATEQLAARYLELKQKQIGQTIEPSRYLDELRRAKHYIATRNAYGVDLNATAVELGSLSLWLGSMHRLLVEESEHGDQDIYQPGATPWFGLRLRCGNSLIGARRSVWTSTELGQGKHYGKKSAVPRLLKPGEKRQPNEIYHFLVFDEDMVPAHKDRLMRSFWPDECETAKEWVRQQVKTKWTQPELTEALALCDLIDNHWQNYSQERAAALEETACTASVWPEPANSEKALQQGPSLSDQETICNILEESSGSFQRLKLLMDTWCALWFWPLDKVDELPRRKSFLAALGLLLGHKTPDQSAWPLLSVHLGFEVEVLIKATEEKVPDTAILSAAVSWFDISHELAKEQNFHHWELVFPEILGVGTENRGFSLVLGNPPWVKASWNDAVVLDEFDVSLGVSEAKSAQYNRARLPLLEDLQNRIFYAGEFRRGDGSVTFLNSHHEYPLLAGIQTNLYKNFIVKSWAILSEDGISGLLHPEGIYNDSKGGFFRTNCYLRLVAHYQFQNWLELFKDVKTNRKFSINIYSGVIGKVNFHNISNLYHPKTIRASFSQQNENSPIPGLRDTEGNWSTRGHILRILKITNDELSLFSELIEEPGVSSHSARLPSIHSQRSLAVLSKWKHTAKRLIDIRNNYFSTEFFHESNAQRDGLLTKCDNPTFQPTKIDDLIMVLGHLYVATPFCKIPLSGLSTQTKYEDLNIVSIEDNFIPSSIYKPGDKYGDCDKYNQKIPTWKDDKKITDFYRFANRRRSQPDDTRTLIPTIIPPGVSHVNSIFSVVFSDTREMVLFAGSASSIVYDFFAKSLGKEDWRHDTISKLPLLEGCYVQPIIRRCLRLNCLTKHFNSLWVEICDAQISKEKWTSDNLILQNQFEKKWEDLLPSSWDHLTPLRSDYGRRQALLEIDVLVALSFEIDLIELLSIYRHHFFTYRKYDLIDEYDLLGNLLPNTTRRSQGGKEFRNARANWDGESPLTVSWPIDNGNQTVTKTFYPPFTKVDREADYEQAYRVFSERYGGTII